MRLLANENFPGDAVEALRRLGHDVAWVRTDAPGSKDTEVLRRAAQEERVLVTLDKDFGELAFRAGLPATSGVVLFRIFPPLPGPLADVAVAAFREERDYSGLFVLVEAARIRERPLPRLG